MYTSYIGQKFLELYNRKTGNNYSASEFFDKELFPLFFDDERHLMHVSNSPFFQTPPDKELKASGLTRSRFQYQKLKQKVAQVAEAESEQPDGSFYVGFAAKGPEQVTSGQVSSMLFKTTADELYASWIGGALTARVEGGLCLLLESEPTLWHLYMGWKVYRNYLQPVKAMNGRQIETWNGYWLAKGSLDKSPSPPIKSGQLDTYPWLEAIASLLRWHSGQVLPVYVFMPKETNVTYGFINLHLPELKRLSEARFVLKRSLLSMEEDDASFWEHYKPDFSLRHACEFGEIGLRALRPKDYAKFMEGNYSPIRLNDKTKQTFFNIQTWIIAMLNNKSDLQKLASDLAVELVATEKSGSGKDRGKTSDSAEAKALFETKGLTSFIEALTSFLEKNNAAASVCRAVVDQAVRIPGEQFPLFKALIRFEYAYNKNK